MTPRYRVEKREGVKGPAIPDDEPYMVIRAQDKLAVIMMDTYLAAYDSLPAGARDPRVIDELLTHRADLVAWQEANRGRCKYADR